MTVEKTRHANGTSWVTTTECSFCGAAIDNQESMAKHLRYDCPEYGGDDDE